MIKRLVLLGPQASGKSTQTKVISDFLQVPVISAGKLLNEVVSRQTELGDKIKGIMDRGELVSDEHMINLILGELHAPRCLNGFVLDGFPRNLVQAKALDDSCGVDKVLNIEISDEEAIRRISGRRVCSQGHVFHTEYQPSSQGDKCDICGHNLYQRDDDKEAVVKTRLSIYRAETSKLIDYYKRQDKLYIINGEQPITKVSEDILDYLKKNAG